MTGQVESLIGTCPVSALNWQWEKSVKEAANYSTEATVFGVADRLAIHARIGDEATSPGAFAGTVKTNRAWPHW